MRQPRHFDDHELVTGLDGEFDARRQSAFDAHLAGCEPCASRGRQLTLMLRRFALRREPDAADDADASAAARARLAIALRAEANRRPGRSAWSPASGPAWWRVNAACAAVGLLVVVGLSFRGTAGTARRDVAALPLAGVTPGAVSTLSAAELCAGARPPRVVSDAVRGQVLRAYGMEQVSQDAYELDALITPELGGTTELANLWPQRYASPVWNAHVKDALEAFLADKVCRQEMDLATAQREIATDWVAAYQRHFSTDLPRDADRRRAAEEEDLLFVSDDHLLTFGHAPPMRPL